MRALSTPELLDIWERGSDKLPVQRALGLLTAACPEMSTDALAELGIGLRDAKLLTLRELTFGSQLVSLATCPGCSQRLELSFDVTDIRVASKTEPVESLSLNVDGYEIRFRLPNSLDINSIATSADIASTRRLLLQRCVKQCFRNGRRTSTRKLPAKVVDAAVEQMAQADPQADVQLDLECPSCGHKWQAAFDIVSFFWAEINAWAHRVLGEVSVLASAYGWREADILAMSPWRRQYYLKMVGG